MLKNLPKGSNSMDDVFQKLEDYTRNDIEVKGGRLFTYLYDSGIEELSKANEIFVKFLNRNAMDYHAFPSTLRLENDVVAMIASLLNGSNEATGNFTTGGTESILIAVKAARDLYRERTGDDNGEIIIPVTAHPAFRKAAEYVGLKTVRISVNRETFTVEPEDVRKTVNSHTAMIVASAPNFPYGAIDPIDDIGIIAQENNTWLHVDACVGGMILPFLKTVGEPIKKWDFSVPGVCSISVDLHKYGYTPKGSSVILYKNKELRKYQLYVNADWPGYPMSNVGVQSTKSSAPLAASWAVLNYLGQEGYVELARKTISAKKKIVEGIRNLGYSILGGAETTIYAFTRDDLDMFEVGARLKEHGWFLQVQPGSVEMGMPPSLHLNTSPVHDVVADDFIKALTEVSKGLKGRKPRSRKEVLEKIGITGESIDQDRITKILTSEDSPLSKDKNLLYELIRYIPAEVVEKAFKDMVNGDFRPTME